MRATIRSSFVAVGLGVLLVIPAVAPAQVFAGVGGGVNFAPPGLHYRSGFTAQASIGGRISPRFETRLDGFVSHWDVVNPPVGVLCMDPPLPGACCGICQFPTHTSVAGLTGNGIVNVTSALRGPRVYFIGGVGAHYSYQNSDEIRVVRLGVSAGVVARGEWDPDRELSWKRATTPW